VKNSLRVRHDSPSAPPPKVSKSTKAKLVKYHPEPILATKSGVMTAEIAAAGFLSMFSTAIAPAAACGAHSVKKAKVTTRTDDMPSPARLQIVFRQRKRTKHSTRFEVGNHPLRKVDTKTAAG
jgi:hypothetical protein